MTTPPLAAHRGLALWAALCCWVGCALIGVHYAGRTDLGPFDGAITRTLGAVVGNPKPMGKWAVIPPTAPTRVLGALSNPVLIYAVIAAVVVFAVWRRRWELAALAVLAPGLCALVTEVSKPWFGRYHDGYLSYPSGHMSTSSAALTVALLAVTGGWSRRRRLLAVAGWAIVVFCTAAGLVAMNYHYPSDVAGGFLLALGVVLPGAVLADVVGARRSRPPAPTRAAPLART
ncbi:MAG TPA: phosphatase PAP2 family protein [Pseudonocardiaceae bacterium]|nr:phosphatase PAP2 family protein [Pseudonocardiaceae bacterium]